MSEDEKKSEGLPPEVAGIAEVWAAVGDLGASAAKLFEVAKTTDVVARSMGVMGAKAIGRNLTAFIREADPRYDATGPAAADVWPDEFPHHLHPGEQEAAYRRVLAAFRFKGAGIPEHMHDTVVGYLVRHEHPCDEFFMAMVANDLREAVRAADEKNIVSLHAWVAFFHNFAPSPAWGSGKRVQAWLEAGRSDAVLDAGAPIEAGAPVVLGDDGKAYPAGRPIHFAWRNEIVCGEPGFMVDHAKGTLAERMLATTCEACKGLMFDAIAPDVLTLDVPMPSGKTRPMTPKAFREVMFDSVSVDVHVPPGKKVTMTPAQLRQMLVNAGALVHAAGHVGAECGIKTPSVLIAEAGDEITCPNCQRLAAREVNKGPNAAAPVHCFVWRGRMACGSNRDADLIANAGSLAERIAATTCETCKGLMGQLVEPRTAPVIHLFRAATATALCGNDETVHGVSCYPGDYLVMVRKINPEAVPCERCLEVSRI